MISRPNLIKALRAERGVADWVVVERAQELASAGGDAVRRERRAQFTVIVHHDGPRGRGSARLDVTSAGLTRTAGDDSTEVVRHALGLAVAAIGAPWQSAPPAAPAKVGVLDPGLVELDARAGELVAEARAAGAKTARARVMREQVWVNAGSGFHAEWTASAQRLDAVVGAGARQLEVSREERTRDRLQLADAIASAVRDLGELARAAPAAAGTYDVVLGPEALLHGGGYGLWHVFVVQADATVEHQGITRYRLDSPIVPGADEVAEPLSITSDGALPYAILSAPVGEDGHAIRKFPLIERGTCIGLGMSAREAALRRRDPNGGVRNLIVAPGTWTGKLSGDRTLEVRRLRSLAIDPASGDASLEVLLATRGGVPVTGGTLRLDVVAALATARRSATTLARGPYAGPAAIAIPNVELIV